MKSDAELVAMARSGESEAFGLLVSRYERAAWATAWKVLRDEHAASDVVQEAFLKAYSNLRHLREAARFGGWVVQITRREAIRLGRRRGKRGKAIDDIEEINLANDPSPEGFSPDSEALLGAVGRLPDGERLAVMLRFIEGHSVAAIATIRGVPVGTVTKQLSRAMARLKLGLVEYCS